MHTIRSGLAGSVVVWLTMAAAAHAQNPPTRLPAVVINARPDAPGPRKIAGTVRDTFAIPIDAAEISVPALQRRIFSQPDGSFRFENVSPGTYEIRARRIGYLPQVQTVVVNDSGGVGVFGLLPTARSLAPVISIATRGGLSGRVGDTSFRALPGATVRILGHTQVTTTDSLGEFFIPLKAGSYTASVTQPGYDFRLVSVIIPPDSGRSVTVYLATRDKPVRHESGPNLFELHRRLEFNVPSSSSVLTRAQLQKMGVEWALDGVRRGYGTMASARAMWIDADCSAVVNGGPDIVEVNTLTIDDIEMVEIYPRGASPRTSADKNIRARAGAGIDASPTRNATWANRTKACPLIYVWLR